MAGIQNKIREKISGTRVRYRDGEFNLDLTYITPRIIAMGYPGEGAEGFYRNRISEVAKLFRTHHDGHYLLINLSGRRYDYSKFDNQVLEFGFPDHHSPPLYLLLKIMKSIDSWLKADQKNVVSVHCLAGQGRTGTVIACYLSYCGMFAEPLDSLTYFGAKRSYTEVGVSVPSQRRYVGYFANLLREVYPVKQVLHIAKILVYGLPRYDAEPVLQVFNGSTCMYDSSAAGGRQTSEDEGSTESEGGSEGPTRYTPANKFAKYVVDCHVMGDVYLKCHSAKGQLVFRIAFHTGYVEAKTLSLRKNEVDHACKRKEFGDDFYVDIGLAPSHLDAETFTTEDPFAYSERLTQDRTMGTAISHAKEVPTPVIGSHEKLHPHPGPVRRLIVDGGVVWTSGSGGLVLAQAVSNAQELCRYTSPPADGETDTGSFLEPVEVTCLAVEGPHIAAGLEDGRVCLFDSKEAWIALGESGVSLEPVPPQSILAHESHAVTSVCLSQGILFSGHANGDTYGTRLGVDDEPFLHISGSGASVVGIACIPSAGNVLFTLTSDGTLSCYTLDLEHSMAVLQSSEHLGVEGCVLRASEDGNKFFAGGASGTLKSWSVRLEDHVTDVSKDDGISEESLQAHDSPVTLTGVQTYKGHGNSIHSIVDCEDLLYTAASDGTVRVWDTKSATPLLSLPMESMCISLHSYGPVLYVGAEDGSITSFQVNLR